MPAASRTGRSGSSMWPRGWPSPSARRGLAAPTSPSAVRGVTGAPTDLRGQADAFLAARGGRLDPAALYVVGRANDLLGSGPGSSEAVAAAAADRLARIVDDLAAAGVPGSWSRTCPMSATGPARGRASGRRRRKAAEPCLRQRARAGARGGGEPSPHPDRPARPLRPGGPGDGRPRRIRLPRHHPPLRRHRLLRGLPVLGPDPPHRLRPRPLSAVALEVLGFDVARPPATAN